MAFPRGDLVARRRDFAKGLAVIGHVRHHDEDVHVLFVGEVFGGGQGAAGRKEPLDGGAVRQGEEHDDAREDARLLEGVDEVARDVVFDAHAGEDDGELSLPSPHLGLPDYLGGQPVVRQPVARENGQLLTTDQGVHPVYGRYARLDEVPGVDARAGIDGETVYVAQIGGCYFRIAVDGLAETVEDAPHDVGADTELEGLSQVFDPCLVKRYAGGVGKKLYGHGLFGDIDDTAYPQLPVPVLDAHEF